ncbi:hypothetical protein A167_01263 [Alcanivorax sp. S71-1-4]|uniref:TIGR04282 family arsenosugar biosynthesis glycosyltransferase n=1 Tax=Alcanivorax sp. S71-1-4 TaxID=1177159 RepID=UPI001359806C|nr:TIGR04282 family arsenosugar biosynthesis glycosyltransferase [Alcanivorax sp. S71-1-4]KAF0809962.1 hypothetical protein A167_01263 [Alcanivorax sp. S71-1-4]
MVDELVLVLSKGLEPGRAKTRLIPACGEAGADAVHRQLLAATLRHAVASGRPVQCHLDGDRRQAAAALAVPDVGWRPQADGDLGWRMQQALASAHAAGASRVVLVGSDCAALTTAYLARAFDALTRYDFVFGPAEDGGYVLIGSALPSPWCGAPVFTGCRFGGGDALADSLQCLAPHGRIAQLDTLWDVDDAASLARARHAGYLPPE